MEAFKKPSLSILASRLATNLEQVHHYPTSCAIENHPKPILIKINVDGVMFYDMEKAEIGVIARDSRGNAIFANSLDERDVAQSESIEGLSILRGL